MTNPNKAELRRLAEASEQAFANLCEHGGDEAAEAWHAAEEAYSVASGSSVVLALLDECEEYESGMRAIACNLGAGGYNAAELSAAELLSKVNWGIDAFATSQQNLADRLRAERDAALAELEAYKRQLQALINISDATGWERHTCGEIAKARALVGGVRG